MEGDDFNAKFKALSFEERWSERQTKRYRTEAISDDILGNYGVDLTNLEQWQRLCQDVGIEPTPRSIKQCKKVSRV
jgi:hypothetical protein